MQNVPHKWPELIQKLEKYTPDLKVTKVIWELPNEGWIKVNIDGASRGDSRRSSIGKEITYGTNNEAEEVAILEAMRYCVDNRLANVMLQTDSMLMKNVLEGKWGAPWNINEYFEEIKTLIEECNVRVSHILREGNSLADYIANCALDSGDFEAQGFAQLDSNSRMIVNLDKSQCPYLRVKAAKN
ncbi:uncharacterized protein [Nicotiana sylvestris]|uniref:uncharacterized protein n=1 Tax=Nicotiana sylvestris TaxID=4096 RepID=UPI00388CDD68